MYIDDIWYVGGARAEGVLTEFWVWHMQIKYLICILYAKNCPGAFFGNCTPHLDDIWHVGRSISEGKVG